MHKEILRVLKQINEDNQCFLEEIIKEKVRKNNLERLIDGIKYINKRIPDFILKQYAEFFESFCFFCTKCFQNAFTKETLDMLRSSLELYIECVEEIKVEYSNRIKKCISCSHEVIYQPLSQYYKDMYKKYGTDQSGKSETLNQEEYLCPVCGSSDRDRMIISFLKENGLQKAPEGMKVLQFAPAKVISNWIEWNCPHVEYHTTDLYMDDVTFKSDIQNMVMVEDNTYDLIICYHVLEHVQDDEKAMAEMKRILKSDGKLVFLVPINLNQDLIDEEWGLSEEENWRRFGQGDHSRSYGKKGLLERLEKYFHVNQLGEEYFGEEVFRQCNLLDSSILYVLTKSKAVSLSLEEDIVIDEKLFREGPLVSVILPCYNHEKYVAEAIESVINQSYKNIEILVMDDASVDGTAEIMKKYSSYFVKEFYFTENTGGDINVLLQNTKGKYVALMHSDDVWERDKIALQVQYLEEHTDTDFCLSWCKFVDEELNEIDNNIFIQKNRNNYEWMECFWYFGNLLCHPSMVMRAYLVNDEQKYGLACRQLPDFFKWVYVVQKYSIHIIPKVLTKMKIHEKNGFENTSAPTLTNSYRHMVEMGANWINVIRDMEEDFFKKAFKNILINPNFKTKEELKCEKYFLLLSHQDIFVQNSAFAYLNENYNEIRKCLEENYKYTRSHGWKDTIKKGLANQFLNNK